MAVSKSTIVTCLACTKQFSIPPSRVRDGGGKYCSPQCYQSGKAEYLTCAVCSKSFYARPSEILRGRKCCSLQCSGKTKRQRISMICVVCSRPFEAWPSRIRRGWGKCCSYTCKVTTLRIPLEKRFWSKVNKTESCWLWTAALNHGGYGLVGVWHDWMWPAHRVSWMLHVGPIPDGLWVLHNCPGGDNPACVNPAHLWLGTGADNTADMVAKGRQRGAVGENNCFAEISEQSVRDIRNLHEAGRTVKELAIQFAMSETGIRLIVKRKTWKHVA